jgi:putative alpha-1,2-mannosidase
MSRTLTREFSLQTDTITRLTMIVYLRFYCIWDSFRAQHPLLSIIDPNAQAQMVRTLLDIYRNLGKHRVFEQRKFCATADHKSQANFQTAAWPSVRASPKAAPTPMS